VGALLGASAKAEALLGAMRATLAAAPPARGRTAMVLEPRGYVAGHLTLAAAVLRAAGYADAGLAGQPGLEALLIHPPDLLVTATAPRFPSLATDLLRHPALAAIPRRTIPPPLLLCGGPWTAAAILLLEP
jgi:iron complex transport system substrate-binding protein